jgi:hypothetical protein
MHPALLQRPASALQETGDLARSKVTIVAKPTKHGEKWRIRWIDENGQRQSAVFDDYGRAQTELSRQRVEVEEIKRGVRKVVQNFVLCPCARSALQALGLSLLWSPRMRHSALRARRWRD